MALPKINVITSARPVTRMYMQPGEQEILLTLVKSVAPKIFVEIGCNVGLTAQAVLSNIDSIERYYGIDVPVGYQFEIPEQQIERPDQPGKLVKDDPRFQLVLRGEDLPTSADCIFIDGDHGKGAVLQDSLWATRIVNPGGMICWHDYSNPTVQVTEVLDELHAGGRDIWRIAGTWLAVERR